jgi:UDPglucose 6-dehydrogenase
VPHPSVAGRADESAPIAVIGAGYVGLTTAACFARLGHVVRCADRVTERVAALQRGQVPIVEAGLDELVAEGLATGRLSFWSDNGAAVRGAEFVFLCVPTPQGADGHPDMSYVLEAARQIGPHLQPNAIIVNKSTVPVGAAAMVSEAIDRADVSVVSNPEFLREGSALHDFLHPDRIVIGSDDPHAAQRVAALYDGIRAEVVVMNAASAELVKYASNGFLAMKISFANSVAELCEDLGADARDVLASVGRDSRIGERFLQPGPGWGGSCFPKDTAALAAIADDVDRPFSLVRAAMESNESHLRWIVDKAMRLLGGSVKGATVAMWGITFKANTDDTRMSPALEIAARLVAGGAQVRAHDPAGTASVPGVMLCGNPYDVCRGADLLLIATEWDVFTTVDLDQVRSRMRRPAILDARNMLDPADVWARGFMYEGVGIRTVVDLDSLERHVTHERVSV